MSRSYHEAEIAWSVWFTVHSRDDIKTLNKAKPIGFIHHCGTANTFEGQGEGRTGPDFSEPPVCSGCRTDVKHPEECKPFYPGGDRGNQPVQVIRVLKYTYDNAEIAARDMSRWTPAIPHSTGGMRMSSASFPFDAIEWEEA